MIAMEWHNAEHYAELARATRRRADSTDDPDLARRLREVAVKYESHARRLKRLAASS
jgi:hypothetical protein